MATLIPFHVRNKLPLEIAALPEQDIIDVYYAAIEMGEKSTGSYDIAVEAANIAFDRLCRDRRWDEKRGPFRTHFLVLVKNELRRLRIGDSEAKRQKLARAEAAFVEMQGTTSPSAEEILIRREEQAAAEAADEARRELVGRIEEAIAHDVLVHKIFTLFAAGARDIKPAEQAAFLGVTLPELYAAKKRLEYHASRCRKDQVAALRRKNATQGGRS